ncbi:MAG: hypothetical protein GX887_05920 [Firmicutes bacterium]|nr:hypothetical protein [Bacillota bacterium]
MEEQEIRLRDLVEIVWRDRLPIIIITSLAVILTLIYSCFIQKPLFEGVVRINVSHFNYPVNGLIDETAQSGFWTQILSEVEGVSNPVTASDKVTIEPIEYREKVIGEGQIVEIEKADLVEVRFRYPDAVLAGEAANHIGEELLKYVKERRLEILHDKKEELTKELEMIDEQLEKAFSDTHKSTARQNVDSDTLFSSTNVDDIVNVRLMELDPAYRKIAERRGENMMALNVIILEIDKLDNSDLNELSRWIYMGRIPAVPVSGQRFLKIAVAFIFGLIFSVFIVFFKHYMSDDQSSVKSKR